MPTARVLLAASITLLTFYGFSSPAVVAAEPLKALVITGGCFHDYDYQTKAMKEAFEQQKVAVDWTVVTDGCDKTNKAEIALYDDEHWAEEFDVVIHNECFASTDNDDYIRRITKAHKAGTSAVVIHCAMHTYRASKSDDWREFLGVTSRRHDKNKIPFPVKVVAPEHPIMKGFPSNWVSPVDELYIIETVWPGAKPLATAVSQENGSSNPCFWVNEYGAARVFGTTFGHGNETFDDAAFRTALVRGTLWAARKLEQAE